MNISAQAYQLFCVHFPLWRSDHVTWNLPFTCTIMCSMLVVIVIILKLDLLIYFLGVMLTSWDNMGKLSPCSYHVSIFNMIAIVMSTSIFSFFIWFCLYYSPHQQAFSFHMWFVFSLKQKICTGSVVYPPFTLLC